MLVTGVGVLEQGWAVRLRKVPGFTGRQKRILNSIAHKTDRAGSEDNFRFDEKTAHFIVKCMIKLKQKVEIDQSTGNDSDDAKSRYFYLQHFLKDPEFETYITKYSNHVDQHITNNVVFDHEQNFDSDEDVIAEDNSSGDDAPVNDWTTRSLHAAVWRPTSAPNDRRPAFATTYVPPFRRGKKPDG